MIFWAQTVAAIGHYFQYRSISHGAMMDYLTLVEEACSRISKHPESGSPTISNVPGRRVMMTSHKQYKVYYDFDRNTNVAVVVAVFK